MASASGYDEKTLSTMKKNQIGILGDAPVKKGLLGDTPIKTTPIHSAYPSSYTTHGPSLLLHPNFIDGNPCRGPLTNRCNIPDNSDMISNTFMKYIESSKDIKSLTSKILFSCYHKLFLHLLGLVDHHLERGKSKSFVPIITGGMALRFYNPSYLTSDLDVKIYPLGLTDGASYNPETYIDTHVKPIFDYYLGHILHHTETGLVLYNYIEKYLKPFYSIPGFEMIKTVGEMLTNTTHLTFLFNYPNKFDEATQTTTTEIDRSVLKLICILNDGTPHKQVFKLMDISVYNPLDETYNSIIKGYYDTHGKIIKGVDYIPPVSYAILDMLPYYIVDLGFMEYEKESLLEKYEENEYLKSKFERSIKGIDETKVLPKPKYVFMGGKSTRKHLRNKRRKHTHKRKRSRK